MKKLVSTTIFLFLYLFLGLGISQAATSMINGTITVNWDQLGTAVTWDDGSFQFNGADADNGSVTISDYPGAGVVNAEAFFGTDIVGTASTTFTSVFSSGYVENNGIGIVQSASGTSHLRRWFTADIAGEYSFSVDYTFFDSTSTDYPSENVSGYHHASLSFWEGDTQTTEIEAYSVGESNPSSGILTFNTPYLTQGAKYSFEIHTYNAASADSPFNQPVPVPSTIILLGFGILGLVGIGRKKK